MKKNITALWITPWYPHLESPQEGDFIERMALAVNERCKVIIIAFHDWNGKRWKLIKGDSEMEVWHFYYPHFGLSPLKLSSLLIAGLWSYLKFLKFKIDVVHAHVAYPTGIIALLFSKIKNKPLFTTEHWSGFFSDNAINPLSNYFFKNYYPANISIMPVSDFLKRQLQNQGYIANYCVIPNVIDPCTFYPSKGVSAEVNQFRFLFVGTLDTRNKRVDKIIESFAKVSELIPGAELTIIGEGADKAVIEKLIEEKKMESKCKLRGPLSHAQVAEEMRKHHALVLFSKVETFSCVVAEAMATGLPVISSRCGGITEYIKENDGILVGVGQVEELADAMIKLFEKYEYFKPGVPRDIVKYFSPSVVSEAILNQYLGSLKFAKINR